MTVEVASLFVQALQVNVDAIVDQYREWFVESGIFLLVLLAVYVLGRVLVLPPATAALRRRNPRNRTLVHAVEGYLKVAFVVVGVPVAATAAGYGAVIADSAVVVAAATLALGVAGQEVIGNLVSGVFLVADPDFNVGDYVEWDDHAGTIDAIDLRATRIRTIADEVVTVPNAELATSAVRNPYSQGRYRVTERIEVGYGEDLGTVSETLVAVAHEDERVLADPEPVVHVEELGGSGIHLAAHFWVANPDPNGVADVRTGFAARATDRLLAEGVDVAPADGRELSGTVDVASGRSAG